jgi:hypothetical protein
VRREPASSSAAREWRASCPDKIVGRRSRVAGLDHGELAQHRGIFFILFLKYFALGSLPPIP